MVDVPPAPESLIAAPAIQEDNASYLNDSLTTLFGEPLIEDDEGSRETRYGAIVMCVAAQEGKALTLLADHLFSSSLLIAEQIELGLIDSHGKTCVELGSGCGLPSLLSASMSPGPSLVVLTDYPSSVIMEPLAANVERNRAQFADACEVLATSYDWGTDATELTNIISRKKGTSAAVDKFDIMFLSDLLYFDRSHRELVLSITLLLSRGPSSRVYVAAGNYTPPAVCDAFFALARAAGLFFEEQPTPESVWRGTLEVYRTRTDRLSLEMLGIRKASCKWWIGRWID